jgi:hypothetical protein
VTSGNMMRVACQHALRDIVELVSRFAPPHRLPATAAWIDDLSVERYHPMLHLLSPSDLQVLRTQPGFTPRVARTFRLQRCQLFKEYLRYLENDFEHICMALKVLMVRHDRPDLVSVLVLNRMTFASIMVMVQFQLVCYRYGVGAGDTTGLLRLLKLFDGMRLELRTLVPAES